MNLVPAAALPRLDRADRADLVEAVEAKVRPAHLALAVGPLEVKDKEGQVGPAGQEVQAGAASFQRPADRAVLAP